VILSVVDSVDVASVNDVVVIVVVRVRMGDNGNILGLWDVGVCQVCRDDALSVLPHEEDSRRSMQGMGRFSSCHDLVTDI
jgi:hypothetical protein